MPSKSTETLRRFNPISVPGLSKEAVDAVNVALEAMSTWRNTSPIPTRKTANKSSKRWLRLPRCWDGRGKLLIPLATKMQTMTEMQIKTMDQIADAWKEQLKLPDPTTVPGFGAAGSWPSADALQKAAVNPLEFWMLFAEQWQTSWANAMAYWSQAGRPH